MEKMNITNQQHDAFVKSHPNGDLLQLTKWAETKKLTGWYSKRIAVGENGKIVGVGQLLFKKVPKLPYTLCYISRGFVTDYSNKLALEALLENAMQVAKDEKAYAIKIDPDVEVDKGVDAHDRQDRRLADTPRFEIRLIYQPLVLAHGGMKGDSAITIPPRQAAKDNS